MIASIKRNGWNMPISARDWFIIWRCQHSAAIRTPMDIGTRTTRRAGGYEFVEIGISTTSTYLG